VIICTIICAPQQPWHVCAPLVNSSSPELYPWLWYILDLDSIANSTSWLRNSTCVSRKMMVASCTEGVSWWTILWNWLNLFTIKDLGIIIDSNLKFHDHVNSVIHPCMYRVGIIHKSFQFADNYMFQFVTLYKKPIVEYGNFVCH